MSKDQVGTRFRKGISRPFPSRNCISDVIIVFQGIGKSGVKKSLGATWKNIVDGAYFAGFFPALAPLTG